LCAPHRRQRARTGYVLFQHVGERAMIADALHLSWARLAGTTHPADGLTHVQLTWIEQKVEHWIRFGKVAAERIIDRRRRVVAFRPDAVFAFVSWASNSFGTVRSRIDIVRAVRAGEPFSTLPFVRPGGELLLRLDGWPKVRQVLLAIDAVEASGVDPSEAAPDHWGHVHNRLAAGMEPRPYSAERHQAWLERRALQP
jgi:hypothetical protein